MLPSASPADRTSLCPDRAQLERLLRGLLAEQELADIERHVVGCALCEAAFASMANASDSLVDAVRNQPQRMASLDRARNAACAKSDGHHDTDANADRMTPPLMIAPPQASEVASRRFGDYELLEEISRGGMGVVYKARQARLNRLVAIKMILSGQFADSDELRRFHNEAEAAAGLDHPGIVPVFESGEIDGQHFFSMGFVDGQSLAALLATGPLPPRRGAELMVQVADAVHYAHERGVIHRDLKPGNILLDRNGQPRVADFGLAKRVTGDSSLTRTGQAVGTPSYMPPKQAAGKLGRATPLADVYSLGAVLYAALTGRPPFQAANPLDTLFQVLRASPCHLGD